MSRRLGIALLFLLAVGASSCTADSGTADSRPAKQESSKQSTVESSPSDTPSETPSDTTTASVDACELLSADQLADLAGAPVGAAEPELVAGPPACRWPVEKGAFVQAGSLSASDWAQGVPEILRMMEASGLVKDADGKRRLAEMGDLVESKKSLTPTEACAMFSEMLELQGQPAGTPWIVNATPSKEEPLAVSGQMCSAGRFTTVTVANEKGLAKPFPVDEVLQALKQAHRRSLS